MKMGPQGLISFSLIFASAPGSPSSSPLRFIIAFYMANRFKMVRLSGFIPNVCFALLRYNSISSSHRGCRVRFVVPWAPGGSKWARNPPVPQEV